MAAALAAAGLTACGGDDEAGGASAAGSAASDAPEITFNRGGDIWVMNADGSDAEQGISGGRTRWDPDEGTLIAGRLLGSPTFSPDGKRIAFGQIDKAEESKAVEAIYVMNADGSDVTQLTQGPFDNAPVWSPGGQRIVFSRGRPSGDGQYLITDIYVMNADGSGQTRLTTAPELERVNLSGATFSPDGEKIAFLGAEEGEYPRLWMMNADGSEPTQLLERPSVVFRPAFSPDGERILFVAGATAKRPSGFIVVNADGSDPLPVPGTRDFDGSVSWSPAG